MKIAAIILLVFVVLALFFKSKSSQKNTKKPAKIARPAKTRKTKVTAEKNAKNFPGVSIKLCAHACDAAKELEKHRFLSREAPLLPLADCNQLNCACKYVHHNDRRDVNEDRRHAYSMKTELYDTTGNENRRDKKERRESWNSFDDFGE
jgi:hypothetical protein